MHKLILSLFCLISLTVLSQDKMSYQYVDSITDRYFKQREWSKLIVVGKQALFQGVDFKFLQQRIANAYFEKSDYYNAIRYFENALDFDPLDEDCNLFLYYCGLNIGDNSFARNYAGKLSKEMQEQIGQKAIKPVSAIDFEYNFKWNSEKTRSDPNYIRIGMNSQLGYSVNIYQAFSKYNQSVSYDDYYNDYRTAIGQDEYYLLLSGNLNSRTSLDIGYHLLDTKFNTETWDLTLNEMTERVDTLKYVSHFLFGQINYKWYRFDIGLSASLYKTEFNNTSQFGIHLGVGLPGTHNIYLKNSLYYIMDGNSDRIVSSNSLGILFFKKLWMEGSVTFGNLNNYADMKGMYIYNSYDPTLFRSGVSLFWYANKWVTFFTNFTLDKKQQSYLLNYYQQKSISGGIIWKL